MKNKLKILGIINSTVLILSFAFLNFMLFKLNLIPFKYLFAANILLITLVIVVVMFLLKNKTNQTAKKVFNIVSILLIILILIITSYINTTYKFINNMISKDYEYKNYDVIVNKASIYSDISDLDKKEIGYLESDKDYNKLRKEIKEDIEYTEKKYLDIGSLTNNALKKDVDAIVLEDAYYNMLKEEDEEFSKNTRVIARYKVKIKKKKNKSNVSTKENPFILLISGIDTHGSISKVSRSDVNIVAAVNPNTKNILLVHIPRDYYVNLHGIGAKDKLTHAGIYGIDMSEETIEDLLGIDINYYIRVNFATLTKSIDLIGGIDVYSDKKFIPWTNRSLTIKQGMNHMDGKMALAFSRERKTYERGDRHRGENQEAVITAMIDKMTEPEYLFKYNSILNSLDGTFETNMSYENITNLVKRQIDDMTKWNIKSIGVDGTGSKNTTYSMGSRLLYVMIPDQASVEKAKNEIKNLTK